MSLAHLRFVEPRMRRRDDVERQRQRAEKLIRPTYADAGMKEQQRRPFAGAVHLDLDTVHNELFDHGATLLYVKYISLLCEEAGKVSTDFPKHAQRTRKCGAQRAVRVRARVRPHGR